MFTSQKDSKPISPENRQFLRRSQCGFANKIPYVCCADDPTLDILVNKNSVESTTPASIPGWLEKLHQLLPRPALCGLDAQNRIFGGTDTEITEFPWSVLLEFTKRKSDWV